MGLAGWLVMQSFSIVSRQLRRSHGGRTHRHIMSRRIGDRCVGRPGRRGFVILAHRLITRPFRYQHSTDCQDGEDEEGEEYQPG